MSINSERISCTGCNYEGAALHRPITLIYRLRGGQGIEAYRTSGWCYQCDDYRDIEDMDKDRLKARIAAKASEIAEKRVRLAELSGKFLSRVRFRSEIRSSTWTIEHLESETEALTRCLDIASTRKARSRCLECWLDHTAVVEFGEDGLAHGFTHRCGGVLKRGSDSDGLRIFFNPTVLVLNEEGELLERR